MTNREWLEMKSDYDYAMNISILLEEKGRADFTSWLKQEHTDVFECIYPPYRPSFDFGSIMSEIFKEHERDLIGQIKGEQKWLKKQKTLSQLC